MSIYSNVTEQDLIKLRKLAEQQKNQRHLKNKNGISKQCHDIKLAESLSPITERLDEVKKSSQEVGEIIKTNNTPQLAIENTPTTHQLMENTPTTQQPIENIEGTVNDVEIEKTLTKMTDNSGFFKTYHDPQRGWMINNHPIKMLRRTKVEISENKYNISPCIRKVLVDQRCDTAKSMADMDKLVFRDILQKTGYYNRKPIKGRLTRRDRYIKYDLDIDVGRFLNLDTKLKGRVVEKIFIASNIIDNYTRLEVLHGLKLSGQNDTLIEAGNLIDELYKRGEIQNKQQYRSALNNFLTH